MSLTASVPGDPHLSTWISDLLFILNILTFIVTIFNLIYLRYKVPNITNRSWNSVTRRSVISIASAEEFRGLNTYFYRKAIEKYFYFISIIPLFVSISCHFGARYPHESIWIFPGMNIVIAIAYLLFIRMLIISCDGWEKIKCILINEEDECKSYIPFYKTCIKKIFCKCFLRKNAFIGLKQRMYLCLLIMLKPVVNYIVAYWEYDKSSFTNSNIYLSYFFKFLALLTTVIPLKCMESFHCALLPHTRLRRSTIKRVFISFLSPIVQLQQTIMSIAFNIFHFDDDISFGNIEAKYEWTVIYGLLLSIEMLIFSLITIYPFNPKDLRLWQYSESLLKQDQITNIEFMNINGIEMNKFMPFNPEEYDDDNHDNTHNDSVDIMYDTNISEEVKS